MSETRKRRLFPFFLFIGMGVGFLLIDRLGGTAFVACMFIGMGLGFLFDSIFEVRTEKVEVKMPTSLAGVALALIGVIFILGGFSFLFFGELIKRLMHYFVGLGFIVVGIFLLIQGTLVFRRK